MSFIKRAWRGQEKLWKVFWLLGLLGNYIVNSIVSGIVHLGIPISAISLVYAVFSWILILRCAKNTSQPAWRDLARLTVILAIAGSVYDVFAPYYFGGAA